MALSEMLTSEEADAEEGGPLLCGRCWAWGQYMDDESHFAPHQPEASDG